MNSASINNNYLHLIQQHIQTQTETIAFHLPNTEAKKNNNPENNAHHIAISYGELGERIYAIQLGLKRAGFKAQDRMIILFPVSLDLYAVVLALLGLKMTPVFIDIGMSLGRIIYSIKTSNAKAVISFQRFLKLRFLLPALWSLDCYSTDSQGLGLKPFSDLLVSHHSTEKQLPEVLACEKNQHAIITFTSGSTGKPKAADRNHRLLIAQYHGIGQAHDQVVAGGHCLSCFPVFVLYTLARGLTTVLPDMDFRRSGAIDAPRIWAQLAEFKIQYLIAGPAFVECLCDIETDEAQSLADLPHLQEIVVGGAPVSRKLAQKIRQRFPQAKAHIGYGSTEAEPISHMLMSDMLKQQAPLGGNLVGIPAKGMQVRIAQIDEANLQFDTAKPNALPHFALQKNLCQAEHIGDILLAGDAVLAHYLSPADDQRCKLRDENGQVWHRIGDRGYWQKNGALVLVGRDNNQVIHDGKTIYPLMIETALMNQPEIRFAAYLSLPLKGKETVVLCLQLAKNFRDTAEQKAQLLATIKNLFSTYSLSLPQLYCVDQMPVDGRHNSKIDRKILIKQLQKRFFSPVKPCLLSKEMTL